MSGEDSRVILTGDLVCTRCVNTYTIVEGIPHFIKRDHLVGLNRRFAGMYDIFSWFYPAFSAMGFVLIGMSEERGRREILDRLEPRGGRVLEISIGPGVNLPYLVKRKDVSEVIGLDISLGQLKRCQAFAKRKDWDVDLLLGNAEQLPVQDETFESVFHIGGINFFNDKKAAIEEMIRVAKPGGRICICDETERGAHWYEHFIPGFKAAFEEGRAPITAPVEFVHTKMQDVRVFDVWKGWMYCLEFRKP
jgi:ubiquinone/menaquinone biosynthesis C-methylase UbiE